MSRNVAASVRQRLRNRARAEGRPFDEVLQTLVLERFLYRLGQSPYRSQFVRKGALMLAAWRAPLARPTRDIDLLGRLDNSVEHVVSVIRVICAVPAPEDGLRFAVESVAGERITEAAAYAGVRVQLLAYLEKARIHVQLDIGFGDAVVPGPAPVQLPSILGFPAPQLQGYSRESLIAEKVQAMVYLGAVNSRMKDFYDLWLLATHFDFDGATLAQAIRETFRRRQTSFPTDLVAWSVDFAMERSRQAMWQAFVRRHQAEDAPAALQEAVAVIAAFLQPVVSALTEGKPFAFRWRTGGPWE